MRFTVINMYNEIEDGYQSLRPLPAVTGRRQEPILNSPFFLCMLPITLMKPLTHMI